MVTEHLLISNRFLFTQVPPCSIGSLIGAFITSSFWRQKNIWEKSLLLTLNGWSNLPLGFSKPVTQRNYRPRRKRKSWNHCTTNSRSQTHGVFLVLLVDLEDDKHFTSENIKKIFLYQKIFPSPSTNSFYSKISLLWFVFGIKKTTV